MNEQRYAVGVGTGTTRRCQDEPKPTEMCPLVSNVALPEHASAERVALMHYGTKSRQDFHIKMERGPGGTGSAKKKHYFDRLEQCAPARQPASQPAFAS